ncbi:MAG: aspartate--tRNA ligase [Spirochaetaceae bacterium]|jgi:aspartyl-tRNA synthetase|nr:aspartate--tRNA ligase [Spirochaetaceae bacterium]
MEKFIRTSTCGELRASDAGTAQTLNGWVHRKRDHGGIFFINLRDRYGLTQVVVDESADAELATAALELRNEYCIAVSGVVRLRPDSMKNPEMETGDVELLADKIVILNKCAPLPFQIEDDPSAKDELRLKYRYLDLRGNSMQKRMRLRSEVSFAVREWMRAHGFYEIETPTLVRSTPEGARDYLVPSRLYAGQFYALPQSPQLYKQLLMTAGFDKYFQIARCYRDEDSRGDRQPEFTQIDIEMSFVSRDDVLKMTEGLFSHIFKQCLGVDIPKEFPRLSYNEAMENYGTDKPDLRYDMRLRDFSVFAAQSGFEAFKAALAAGGVVKAIVVPGGASYSRKQIEELEAHAKIYKAKGLAWMKAAEGTGFEGGAAKFFASKAGEIMPAIGAKAGDLVLMVADANRRTANVSLGAVRTKLGNDLGLCDSSKFCFTWVIDFPLFEFNEEEGRWEAAHHLFSYPQEQYHASMEADPGAVKGDLYDLVLNGYELASGSIRIHDPELQKKVFKIAGLSEAEAAQKFGFLTDAFSYGAPPHGGIAPGLDRLVMLMSGDSSIKEVIAFPKNSFAQSPMDGSPGDVDDKQLSELHLKIVKPNPS